MRQWLVLQWWVCPWGDDAIATFAGVAWDAVPSCWSSGHSLWPLGYATTSGLSEHEPSLKRTVRPHLHLLDSGSHAALMSGVYFISVRTCSTTADALTDAHKSINVHCVGSDHNQAVVSVVSLLLWEETHSVRLYRLVFPPSFSMPPPQENFIDQYTAFNFHLFFSLQRLSCPTSFFFFFFLLLVFWYRGSLCSLGGPGLALENRLALNSLISILKKEPGLWMVTPQPLTSKWTLGNVAQVLTHLQQVLLVPEPSVPEPSVPEPSS